MNSCNKKTLLALEIMLGGTVQAVGFRPFVYRLAKHYQLAGSIQNQNGVVKIIAQGDENDLNAFQTDLITQAPPLAKPYLISVTRTALRNQNNFLIEKSHESIVSDIHIPADYCLCEDCLNEMLEPDNRRYHYPLISCTQCGPRYTIINSLPYDRCNTTFADYVLCPQCQQEYDNPDNRRFHAETISCHHCGPQLTYAEKHQQLTGSNYEVITHAVKQLAQGRILAVKGIGGYHLLCDATNDQAISHLREKKRRPHKPFAVMFPLADFQMQLAKHCVIKQEQITLLHSRQRPIVLLEKARTFSLPQSLSPGLNHLGALLPYSPLHTLLLMEFGKPLVATSGNISGEPVIIDNDEAENKLKNIADGFIHHDRKILQPVDDSVFHFINHRPQPLRLGRGVTPLELELPFRLDTPCLALGAMFKNSVALAWDNRLVLSPHIGDMDTPSSLRTLEKVSEQLQQLYKVRARVLVHDAHPQYSQSRWAKKQHMLCRAVYHHHAHASALAFEQPHIKQWLTFTWDGTGYGADHTIWGGETLHGSPGLWQRVASLRPFYLPGGDSVNNKPLLSAFSLCWEAAVEPDFSAPDGLLKQMWDKRINCPQSTAIGRVFDAAAAILGIVNETSFQGQAPMLLEASSNRECNSYVELSLNYSEKRKLWEIDWAPLLKMLMDNSLDLAQRAASLHCSLARVIFKQVKQFKNSHTFEAVGFSGGVFQNQLLCRQIAILLQAENITFYFHERLPCNDAGISVGQVMEQIKN